MQLFTPLVATFALLSFGTLAKVQEETKSIDDLYAEAVAEGGKLVLYHGGDTPTQQDSLHEAFQQRFPEINFTLIVDYSKYHDVRIDNQLETGTLVPDVVALQTLQDFTRRADQGKLLQYKPKGFSNIHSSLRDNDGAWMAYTIYSFYTSYNSSSLDGIAAPPSMENLTDSEWAGKIASSYPNDDDAVLYLYTRYVELYGWDWVAKLANQSVAFHRGSNVAAERVAAGEEVIGMGTDTGGNVAVGNNTEYISWGQRVAILAKAKHPAAAKLFMNWALSEEVQSDTVAPSVRTDINTDKPWDISEANMANFPLFMEDRAKVEEWKQTFTLYFAKSRASRPRASSACTLASKVALYLQLKINDNLCLDDSQSIHSFIRLKLTLIHTLTPLPVFIPQNFTPPLTPSCRRTVPTSDHLRRNERSSPPSRPRCS